MSDSKNHNAELSESSKREYEERRTDSQNIKSTHERRADKKRQVDSEVNLFEKMKQEETANRKNESGKKQYRKDEKRRKNNYNSKNRGKSSMNRKKFTGINSKRSAASDRKKLLKVIEDRAIESFLMKLKTAEPSNLGRLDLSPRSDIENKVKESGSEKINAANSREDNSVADNSGEFRRRRSFDEDYKQKESAKLQREENEEAQREFVPDPDSRIAEGCLELIPAGYGFIRVDNYNSGPDDVYLPAHLINRFNLRKGDYISGYCRPPKSSNQYDAMYRVNTVNGYPPDTDLKRDDFDRLKAVYPDERYVLETEPQTLSTRMIDLLAPLGKGQRGLIVSPPKAGKTTILKDIAHAINTNYPKTHLIVLLVDERPEEVSDMQNSIEGEIIYSTFDRSPENHVRVSELVLERAHRLVEIGEDVVILLDSITRMGRAYNLTVDSGGRTLSGGLDPAALRGPKRFFGSARKIEDGGSLTIIATALVDTGSRLDDLIFEEFKGTGNMEIYLDRKLAEKRVFPAIDVNKSGTRREDLLLDEDELKAVWSLRRSLAGMDSANLINSLSRMLEKTGNNQRFIDFLLQSLQS